MIVGDTNSSRHCTVSVTKEGGTPAWGVGVEIADVGSAGLGEIVTEAGVRLAGLQAVNTSARAVVQTAIGVFSLRNVMKMVRSGNAVA